MAITLTDGDHGTVTFEEYLRARSNADGVIEHPHAR
jgi:hypothetical protein